MPCPAASWSVVKGHSDPILSSAQAPFTLWSPLRRGIALILSYIVATGVMTNPFVNYSALASASYEGDARLIIWTLAWDAHALLARLPLFNSNIFYPAPHSLAYNEHLFGLSLFTLPIYAATGNPVLSYNIIWLLSFVLNALLTHAWLRRHVHSDAAAAVGSLVFTFGFYKMLHAHGHLHLVWTWLLPASAIALERWSERPSLGRATTWAAAVLLQALASWYLAVIAALFQLVLLLGLSPGLWKSGSARWLWHLVVVTVAAGLMLWPFARMYRDLAPASPGERAEYSADLAGYLIPPENTWGGQLWLTHVGAGPRWIWGEQTVFVGWTVLTLSVLGLWVLVGQRRWRLAFTYGGLVILAGAFSLGPSLHPRGRWAAFALVGGVPGLQASGPRLVLRCSYCSARRCSRRLELNASRGDAAVGLCCRS